MASVNECVDDATARARCVLPVPGGPWRRIPRGGLSPALQKRVRTLPAVLEDDRCTEMAEQVWPCQRYLYEIPDFGDLLIHAPDCRIRKCSIFAIVNLSEEIRCRDVAA